MASPKQIIGMVDFVVTLLFGMCVFNNLVIGATFRQAGINAASENLRALYYLATPTIYLCMAYIFLRFGIWTVSKVKHA